MPRAAFAASTETPEQVRERRALEAKQLAMGHEHDEANPPEPRWGPSTPKALLAIPRQDNGYPVEEPAPTDRPEEPWAKEQREKRNLELYKAWVNLDERERSQVIVDLRYGKVRAPLGSVRAS
jgi:hypothetical protein